MFTTDAHGTTTHDRRRHADRRRRPTTRVTVRHTTPRPPTDAHRADRLYMGEGF